MSDGNEIIGKKVRDTVTGFEGMVVARTVWLNGCARLAVQSDGRNDGVPVDPYWVDEQQCDVVLAAGELPDAEVPAFTRAPGGPRRDPRSPVGQ